MELDKATLVHFWEQAQGKDKIFFHQRFGDFLKNLPDEPKQRTSDQNRFLHGWIRDCAKVCLENGIDVRTALTKFQHLDVPMDEKMFKRLFVHHVIKNKFEKDPTAKLTTAEIDQIPDPIIKRFSEEGVTLPPFVPTPNSTEH